MRFDYADARSTIIRFAFRGIEIAAKIPVGERISILEADAIRDMLCGDPRPSVRAEHAPTCVGCAVCGG